MDALSKNYREFIVDNRAKANRYLNWALWLFALTGPALALGVSMGVFQSVEYVLCVGISLAAVALAAIHLALMKLQPDSVLTVLFALMALDALIFYMALGGIDVNLLWFLVPLLAVLFCDRRIYLSALALSYVLMLAAMWTTAPSPAGAGASPGDVQSYLLTTMGSFTIGMAALAVAGYLIVKLSSGYFEELFRQQEIIEDQEASARERVEVLDSMAEIYDNVNLISFVDNTEMSLRDPERKKHVIDMPAQTHTLMNQRIKNQVMEDQLEEFLTFTNITTVRGRMKDKKIISADFIDVVSGWFRAQYITVEPGPDGLPNTVIYTTRNVDEEKRREEYLVRLSMTDELTRLYNRRRYEEDLAEVRAGQLEDDLVVFSVDVDGLKAVNDTLGHAAGDELIKGTAECLLQSVGQSGKVYRTGGDEFMALVHTRSPESLREAIRAKAAGWHGALVGEMALSAGFASHDEHREATVDDLERLADADMYAEKERHYAQARAVGAGPIR